MAELAHHFLFGESALSTRVVISQEYPRKFTSPAGRILVLAKKSLGGVFIFCESIARDSANVDVFYYAEGNITGFDAAANVFRINRFDPLVYVYRCLRRQIRFHQYDVLVANEGFELAFLAWAAPVQAICFVVHVNHRHSYEPAIRFADTVDRFYCVSDTGAVYLRARGIRHVTTFRYSTFIPREPDVPKKRKVVYVGRFVADKNIEETISLLKFLQKANYEVCMIGGGNLEARVREAFPGESCLVGATRERIYQELAEASFLCHNSYVEGLPIIHTEAIHFRLGIICNYVDKSIYEVTGENVILWSDRENLLRRMESFVFQLPPAPARINNPELNRLFRQEVAKLAGRELRRGRISPTKLLDRLVCCPARVIRAIRELRWRLGGRQRHQ